MAITFDEQGNTADAAKDNELEEDKADEFDQSSDEEVSADDRENTTCPSYFKERLEARRRFS